MDKNDLYIMIIILFIGIGCIYCFHPKPLIITKYPSIDQNKDLTFKDNN